MAEKRGRPFRAGEPGDRRVTFRLTTREWRAVEEAATASGRTVHDHARQLVLIHLASYAELIPDTDEDFCFDELVARKRKALVKGSR